MKPSSEVFSLLSPQVALKSSLFFGRRLTFGGSYSTNVDLLSVYVCFFTYPRSCSLPFWYFVVRF
uniref:Transmembrane protein n=2 Tax=Arabidopsis thaliana TaxID=3702 RepID=Q56XS3_ARATH|nr:unknown protein [Arabidopsis thaliana]BAD95146.1 hypothetical protein [Arabidopsis thaliana]